MLKNCNFAVFFITLGIASVALAGLTNIQDDQDDLGTFHTNLFNTMFSPSPSRLLSPLGFGRGLPKGSSFNEGFDLGDHMSNINSALTQLKNSATKGQDIEGPVTNTIKRKECCDDYGNNCRPMKEGENCKVTRKIKTSFSMSSGTIDPLKTSTNDFGNLKQSSPTEDYSQILPQKSQRLPSKPFSKRSEDDNDAFSKQPLPSMSPLNKNPNGFNKQNLKPGLLPIASSNDNFESEEDLKLIGNGYGGELYYAMPKEKPVQRHEYEKPLGLDDEEVDRIRQQVLKQTNFYRSRYGLSPLKLNNDMNNHAQEWANHLAPTHTIFHRGEGQNKIYGENIYYFSSFKENIGEMCVDSWYQELRFVDVNDKEPEYLNNPKGEVGHLTALLWKKSKETGVGVAKDERGAYYIVANYNPGGNVMGFFEDNLPKFEQSDIDEAQEARKAHEKEHLTPKRVTMRWDPKTKQFVPEDESKLPSGMTSDRLPMPGMGSRMSSSPFSSGFGPSPFSSGMDLSKMFPGLGSSPSMASRRSGGYK